jgi:hypothetical protein
VVVLKRRRTNKTRRLLTLVKEINALVEEQNRRPGILATKDQILPWANRFPNTNPSDKMTSD